MLMRGRDLWVFMPNVSQPVRLPLSQKLTGQVSNGDLARANFTGDYTPSLARSEVIDGREHYVLQLVGIDRGVTYPRVLYWVDRESYRPHRAEFYTRSNRRLKTCLYEGFAAMGGELRPTRLVMEDALRKGNRSVMEYRDMRLRDLPAEVFTKDYLKKLQ
jgi:outer membrane lipoprotein-sorting protein